MPGLRPRNCSTSAGLRDSSSFTLSGERSGDATAAAMFAEGLGAALAASGVAMSSRAARVRARMGLVPFGRAPSYHSRAPAPAPANRLRDRRFRLASANGNLTGVLMATMVEPVADRKA